MNDTVFAQGMCFYKLFVVFVVGGFIGDLTETIFCRIKYKKWTNRSSFLYGQLSVVWGFALMLATLLAYRMHDARWTWIFAVGTVLGGIYEYYCSVFTEKCFGAKFWDYSGHRFNLAGRINLRYCFYWGLAALLWIREIFPPLERWIEGIPASVGETVSNALFVLIIIDGCISMMALKRYAERRKGIGCTYRLEEMIDAHFTDERIERNYPFMKLCESGEPEAEYENLLCRQ